MDGLVSGHAYSIIGMYDSKAVKLTVEAPKKLKHVRRVIEKTTLSHGDASSCFDIVRAMVVVPAVMTITAVLQRIASLADVQIVRCKNRIQEPSCTQLDLILTPKCSLFGTLLASKTVKKTMLKKHQKQDAKKERKRTP